MRLGYAATEHGNQADTVDVAIELVSTATTHRGLYVGATRGRDENRLHVITDTDDLGDARDVLETVLGHDRADIPAVTQRRDLARHVPPQRLEPAWLIPDWVGPWRAGLEHEREKVVDYLDDRARRRVEAAVELGDLQPALAAARAAWQPYRDAIGEIEDELRIELRPALWKVNRDAGRAGFGHHHATARRAKAANDRVVDAEACIAAIRAGAADVKQRLDAVEAHALDLHDLAHPSPAGVGLEDMQRRQLNEIDRMSDAFDVWTTWASGRSIAVADLTNAAEVLADSARRAPVSGSPGEIDRFRWLELLEPVLYLLDQRAVELSHNTLHPEQAGPDLGLDL